MKKINIILKYLGKHLQVLILIPAVLGGIWQLFELAYIDTSFVRFFSVTQVVSDGLIILFLFAVFTLIFYGVSLDDKIKKDKNENVPYDYLGVKIFLLVFFLVAFILTISKNYKTGFSTSKILLSYVYFVGILKVLKDLIVLKSFKKSDLIIRGVFFITSIIGLLIIPFLMKGFHNLYSLPKNINNIKNIECYLNMDNKDFNLLYSNDKYIFIEIKNSGKIEIVNFEELFNKDNCK